ncbi:type IV secretory system conjugative DNA transfer family protein [Kitasatospora sp. NPDC057512]|uniref:type IV secretory system conjugative DNA transfer family protein n=1 Tax=Kitasatospora sp. NPDC057512 TaxID=3346154 RepID=UPI0036B4BC16
MTGDQRSEPTWAATVLGAAVLWLLASGVLAAQAAALLTGHSCCLVGGAGLAAVTWPLRGPGAAFAPAPSGWLWWPLLVLIWSGPVAGGTWLWMRRGTDPGTDGARWGGRATERRLRVAEEPGLRRNRMAFGRSKGRRNWILAAKENISATVFGLPGSSKTTGLVLPIAAEWYGPCVMTTVKAADLDVVYARRAALGPVHVVAPAGLPDRPTARWSPVDYCADAKAADRMAGWLADAASTAGDPRSGPWVDQAKAVVKGVLLAANLAGGDITTFRRWLALADDAVDEVREILVDGGHPDVADDYAAAFALHPDGVGSIRFTLSVITKVYADEEVRATAAASDFTAEEVLDRCATVCLIASEADGERFAPLLTAITASIVHAAQARYQRTGRPLDPALGLVIDEAGNCFRYKALPRLLTVGRGIGITVLTVWHDLSQLIGVLGREAANTVMNASGLRMLLPGNADPETLKAFTNLLGRALVKRKSTSRGGGGSSTSEQLVETDLAPTHVLRELPDFTAIAVYGNQRPVRVKLRRTYADPDLIELLARRPLPPLSATADPVPLVIPPRPGHPPTVAVPLDKPS